VSVLKYDRGVVWLDIRQRDWRNACTPTRARAFVTWVQGVPAGASVADPIYLLLGCQIAKPDQPEAQGKREFRSHSCRGAVFTWAATARQTLFRGGKASKKRPELDQISIGI